MLTFYNTGNIWHREDSILVEISALTIAKMRNFALKLFKHFQRYTRAFHRSALKYKYFEPVYNIDSKLFFSEVALLRDRVNAGVFSIIC